MFISNAYAQAAAPAGWSVVEQDLARVTSGALPVQHAASSAR